MQGKIFDIYKRFFKFQEMDSESVRHKKSLNTAILLTEFILSNELIDMGIFLLNAEMELVVFEHYAILYTIVLGVVLVIFLLNNYWSNTVAVIAFLFLLVLTNLFQDSMENLTLGRSLVLWMFPVVVASFISTPRSSFFLAVIISVFLTIIPVLNGEIPNIYAIGLLVLAGFLLWSLTSSFLKVINHSRTNEQALQKIKEDQAKYIDQIMKASKFKSEFMATMSHELRTPLNAIMGFSDLLSEGLYGKLSNDQLEFMQNVHSSSEHLLHLVNQFLDISKIESGKLTLDIRPVVLNELVNELCMELKLEYSSKGLELNLQGFEQHRIVYADPVQLKQILLNLISNAIKYTMTGSITVQFLEREDSFEINIIDTGIGISEKDFSKVFKEFVRIETPEITSDGSGLGLALTKRLVNMHGGEISFTSKKGVGSTFTFTLPRTLKTFIETRSDFVEIISLETINVLVIEDNSNDFNVIKNILGEIKKMKFDIHREPNLTNGIEYLKNHNEVHLILLDLLLPESEGLETAQAIIDLKLRIPLIILTVLDNLILAAEAIRKGAHDYLIKDEINPKLMERSIRLAFERGKISRL